MVKGQKFICPNDIPISSAAVFITASHHGPAVPEVKA
jgi:hypothetical protein